MTRSHPQTVVIVALLFSLAAFPFSKTVGQDARRESPSMAIDPKEATVHVGHKQGFKAMVKGAPSARIRWEVQESEGGQITGDGTYTAPRHVGLYHIVATSEDPALRAVAKVTVVTESDTPDWLRRRKP